ncbi:MAG: hypothetical protein QM518_14620 [Verrucomicrobiota bacterium]|nr:hypothetical protein [Verrucomicrobiota bacterium]
MVKAIGSRFGFGVIGLCVAFSFSVRAAEWDVFSDTWVATDDLGRVVPTAAEVGPPRADRTVGCFYFLWLGEHINGGPYDVTKILAQDPDAMQKPESPLWGPLHAPHHWGESIFGYYLTDDRAVLRKHGQMLGDAGVDVVIFDVTNQYTYKRWYTALLEEWSAMRRAGNRTPQVAFLCPFWDPPRVVRELYRDLYEPGLYPELWFEWEGKPLILADPDRIGQERQLGAQEDPVLLQAGQTLGQRFRSDEPLVGVSACFPTWETRSSGVTLRLRRGGPEGALLLEQRFERVEDNRWLGLRLEPALAPGEYYLEASEPTGRIGWWSARGPEGGDGGAFVNGRPAAGVRTLRVGRYEEEQARIDEFFTFRKPQPDYFQGPTGPNQWSWLEVSPQHVFYNGAGEKEQMSVGVGQNAVDGRLGAMSEADALGRSFHHGRFDDRPGAVRHGLNFAEQWERALAEDPRFVFVTGWNEWIAGRFREFNGVRLPVMFVDQYDQEHSRDIEPMVGGHGDDYYYQFVSYIRRYKGARGLEHVKSGAIELDGRFADWAEVTPSYRDTIGDPVRREHRGWDPEVTYVNRTGRNDLVEARVSLGDEGRLHFYLRTQDGLVLDGTGLDLLLDMDSSAQTGWLGYDFRVCCGEAAGGRVRLLRNRGGGWDWEEAGHGDVRVKGNELELGLELGVLGLEGVPAQFDFKWADALVGDGTWSDMTLNGDVAPNDRFNYRAMVDGPGPSE